MKMTLGKNVEFDMDSHATKLNNNVILLGSSGSGKSRGIVEPNILACEGSYVISDPKGVLYEKYQEHLIKNGYTVRLVDFSNPARGDHYNFFSYIDSEQDIAKIAHIIAGQVENGRVDPFWDHSAEVLCAALVSYILEFGSENEKNLQTLLKLLGFCRRDERNNGSSTMDVLMRSAEKENPKSFAVRQYNKIGTAPPKTYDSILVTIESKLGAFDTAELKAMMKKDDLKLRTIGDKKTALFVIVPDTDRSMDRLANILFSQVFIELCSHADKECGGSLEIPVRFILDDFATNVVIDSFPQLISTIRSRNISAMIAVQALSQLEACYKEDARTIVANCDTVVYLGTGDVDTMRNIAERAGVPLSKIISMPTDREWIFRRGEKPVFVEKDDIDNYKEIAFKDEKER